MDLKEYPSLLLRKASEDKEIKKLKENIRTEVINTIKRGGCYVDRVISSKDLSLPLYYDSLGHTLLHLSVYYELVDSIEELLSVGARTDICDKFGITAYELALETGNQEVVFKMARRESYQNYLHFIEKYNSILECKYIDDSDEDQDTYPQDRWKVDGNSLRRKVDFYNQSKMLEWDEKIEKARYDDYLLWTDSTRSFHLTKLLSTLEDRERILNASSRELIKRKMSSASLMQEMHEKLREKEHRYSLQIFDNIKLWRSFRRKLLRLTDKVNHIKTVLEEARKKCFWRRDVNFRHYSGLVLKFWTACEMTLTGENITLLEITEESTNSKSSIPDFDEVVAPVDKSRSSHQDACSGDEKSHLVKSNSDDFSWHGSIGYAEERLGRTERTRTRSAASATSAISDEQVRVSREGSERTSSLCDDPEVASIIVENKRAPVGRSLMRRNKKTIERIIPLEAITEVEFRMSSHKKSKDAGSKLKPQLADITITFMEVQINQTAANSDANNTAECLANRKGSVDYRQSAVDLKSVHRGKASKIVIQLRSGSSGTGHRSSLDSLNSATSIDGMDLMEQIQDFEYKLRNLTKEGQITISHSDSSHKNGKPSAGNSFSSVATKGNASLPPESNQMDLPIYSSGVDDTDHDQSDGKNIISDGDDSHSRSYNSSTMASELHSRTRRAIDSFTAENKPLNSSLFCTHRSQSYCSGSCSGRSHHRSVRRQQRLKQKKPIETSSSVRSADFSVSYSSSSSRGKGPPPKASSGDERSGTHIQSSCNDGRSSVSGLTSIESGDLSANSSSMQDIDRLLLKLLNSASASGALSGLDPSLIDISTLSQSYSAGLSSLTPASLRLYLEGDKTMADASPCQDIESIRKILMELTTSARDDDGILETILLSIGRSKAERGSSFSTRAVPAPEPKPKPSQNKNYDDKYMLLCPSESKRVPTRRIEGKKSLIKLISKRSKTSCEIISMLETKVSKYRTERNFYWTRLEEVINTREHLLECLRYLRSLRFVVSNPPSSPTSTLSTTMSSMEEVLDKVISFHDKCESPHRANRRNRDSRYNQQTLSDSMGTPGHGVGVYSAVSMEDITDIRGRLSLDRSEEIRLSLLATNPIVTKTWSPSPGGGLVSPMANTFMSTPLPGSSTEGSVPSTISTVRPSPWKVSIETQQYQQSLIQRRLLQNTVQHSAEKQKKVDSLPPSPASIKKVLFDEKIPQFDSPERRVPTTIGHDDGNLPTERLKSDKSQGSDLKKDGNSPKSCYPLNLGIPPEGCGEDLQNVVGLLRDLWDCELRSFETVGRLTELFVLREQTVTKINELVEKEKKPPPQSELFDIQL